MVNFYSEFVNCNLSRNATIQDVVGTVFFYFDRNLISVTSVEFQRQKSFA